MYKFLLTTIFFFSVFIISAQQKNTASTDTTKSKLLPEIEINGRVKLTSKTTLSTEASSNPASVTLVGRDYIAKQTVNSYGDLLRPLAGVNVSNYQLGGVGYGIQLRGYTVLEHARDIAFNIDGVPQNQGSSIQTNGYTDLNPLIPENIKRIEVIRGPFSPFFGDHALGGVISFETMDKLPSTLTLSGGTYGSARALATVGFGQNDKTGYVSLEGSRTDGYRNNNKDEHLNGMAKFSFPFLKGIASARIQEYTSDFGSPGYIRIEDIDANKISKKTAVSSTDGGKTQQQNLVLNYKGSDTSNYTSATLYVQHHDFIRIRTRNIGGPQRQDRDNRTWAGADLRQTLIRKLGRMPALYAVGLSFRTDNIDNTRFATKDRQLLTQSQDRNVKTTSPGIYAQTQLLLTKKLKFTLGARYDKLFYNLTTGSTDSDLPNQNLKPKTDAFSPKAGIAYQLSEGINIFVNAARKFI